jgi:predicted O-methyltransferase YrrM
MSVFSHYLRWIVGLAAAETQTTPAEQDCLVRHARGRRHLVEIGVWHGVNTVRLRAVMAPDGVLTAVDPFPAGRLGFSVQERIARHQVGRVANGRVSWLKTTGDRAADGHEPVDFVFIDGDHTEQAVLADSLAWNGLVRDGGVVAIHDSRSTSDRSIEDAGSVKVTNAVILKDPRFELVEVADSLTVVRRRTSR